ncbi:MAG TPA: hypothetical protein VHS09_09565 [Polyangiaceae bacterium]|nr:hypothetical protein [Polyangiaceae bacterium]
MIRHEQLRVLGRLATDRFVEANVERLAREHPERFAERGREATLALVRDGVARARSYGVEETGAVRAFLDLMWTVDPEFELSPDLEGVLEVLRDDELSGEAKMEIVSAQMRDAFPDR